MCGIQAAADSTPGLVRFIVKRIFDKIQSIHVTAARSILHLHDGVGSSINKVLREPTSHSTVNVGVLGYILTSDVQAKEVGPIRV